jgi:hypothetical protein
MSQSTSRSGNKVYGTATRLPHLEGFKRHRQKMPNQIKAEQRGLAINVATGLKMEVSQVLSKASKPGRSTIRRIMDGRRRRG